jgi:hypothetical protein
MTEPFNPYPSWDAPNPSEPTPPEDVRLTETQYKTLVDLAKRGAVLSVTPNRFDNAFKALATLEQTVTGVVDLATSQSALNRAAANPEDPTLVRKAGGQLPDGTSFSYVDFPPEALGKGVAGATLEFRKEYNGRHNVVKISYGWGDKNLVDNPEKAGFNLNLSVNDTRSSYSGAELHSGLEFTGRVLEALAKPDVNLQPLVAEQMSKATPLPPTEPMLQ